MDEGEHEPLINQNSGPASRPKLGTLSVAMLGFFWVSGGVYGNEEILSVADPAVVLPLLLILPVFYSLPLLLFTTELSVTRPVESGVPGWTEEGLGSTVGAHNTFWMWVGSVLEGSLYPRFAAAYLAEWLKVGAFTQGCIAAGLVVLMTMVRLHSLRSSVAFSGIMLFLAVIPSMLFLVLALPHAEPSAFVISTDRPTNWHHLLTWLLFLYTGVVNFASVVMDVENPRQAYLFASFLVLLLDVLLINFLPLFLSLSLDPDVGHYEAGHFAALGKKLGGVALEAMFVLGALVSQLGLYNSYSVSTDRYVTRLIRNHGPAALVNFVHADLAHKSEESQTGVPRMAILFNGAISLSMAWFPITATLALSTLPTSLAIILFTVSFLKLKREDPNLANAGVIPFGFIGAVLLATPPFLLASLNFVLAIVSPFLPEFDASPAPLIFLVSLITVGLGAQLIAWYLTSSSDTRQRVKNLPD
eukprot:c2882_g1_i1.p1 GENE.c2882_g1_i1~~c2882_g1_i1.p1  ORF type:complete len:473 (+),score=96.09 c2882_g1_i1:23-1441(+)